MKIIEINNLTKDYGQGRGVYDVSFSIEEGECFGFLGPNGAGKSTTIRHIMAFSKPDKGNIKILGLETWKHREQILEKVGYLPGEIALPKAFTGKEFLDEMKKLKHVKDDAFLNYLIDTFKLDTSLPCKEMSLGMKRKTAIVACFISDPDILIMDEPSSGLDPQMQEVFIAFVKKEKERGKTILLSSHIFEEVNDTCDRIAVIKDGHIVSIINTNSLKHNSLKTYSITFKDKNSLSAFLTKKLYDWDVIDYSIKEYKVVVSLEDSDVNYFFSFLSKLNPLDIRIQSQTLEEYFMSFYKEDLTYGGVK